jgi:hypothetical protein
VRGRGLKHWHGAYTGTLRASLPMRERGLTPLPFNLS